jgi:hypothetical protein
MTKQVWMIEKVTTDKTSDVMSFQYSTGRRTQFDSWSPGSLVLTIRNDNGQANGWNLNDKIILSAVGTFWYQWHYVQEVLYNDIGGNGAGSTATIVCADLMGRLGRIQVFEQSIGSELTLQQIDNEFGALLPSGTSFIINGSGDSTAAADASYSGTVLNRFNLNMVTEQGWVSVTDDSIYLYARSTMDDLGASITFARTASGVYQMGYSDIRRIALGSNYLNTCTVTPPVAAAQNATDTAGVATYGTYGAEFSTVDQSASQALGLAQWQVFSREDPDELSFQISVSDTANDFTELFNSIYNNEPLVEVSYKNPGSNTTLTDTQIMNGWEMSVTPSRTDMEIFTSPLTYTNFFTLNSATFGKLNTSRLGW